MTETNPEDEPTDSPPEGPGEPEPAKANEPAPVGEPEAPEPERAPEAEAVPAPAEPPEAVSPSETEQAEAEARRGRIALLALLFFLSGAAGLVYEVAWSKRLELTFGTTTHSIGTVLAAYMAGLGLGAWWLGGLADRPGSPAKRYAVLEALIGVYGLLAPWILDLIEVIYIGVGGTGGLALKAVLGLIAIFPPTVLMGGTLPILARALVRDRSETQQAVGLLYGINTLGAVVGATLAGFWLVSAFGMDVVSRGTGVVNLALAGLVLLLGHRVALPITESEVEREAATIVPPPDSEAARALRLKIALAATFGCGAVALSLEIAWTRALSLAYGSTGHGFTIVLAATLLGIGLGSLIVARANKDERAPLGPLAGALLLLAASNYLFMFGYELLPRFFYLVAQPRALYYEQLLAVFFTVSCLTLLPSTLALGVAFPLAVQLGTPAAQSAGRSVGRLYLANTAGAILGSLVGGFMLVPILGGQGVIRLGTLAAAVGGGALAWGCSRVGGWPERRAKLLMSLAGVLTLAALVVPTWDPRNLDLGPTRLRTQTPPRQPGLYRGAFRRIGMKQVYAREGLNAFVTVRQSSMVVSLLTGGKTDASDPGDMETQLLVGVLPFLVAPEAEQTLVVGAGCGVTARVVADFGTVKHMDLIEIEEAMVEAARKHFGHVNNGVLDRTDKVRIVYDDARSFVLTSKPAQYDVIVSEPTNPSIAGVANLFTTEFYGAAKKLLKPGGVFACWVQLYQSNDAMARAMLNTVLQSWEHVDLWWANPTDLLLVASEEPLVYDREKIKAAIAGNPALTRDLWPRLFCRTPDELFARFVLHKAELNQVVGDGEILRDKLPRLEGMAARARYENQGTRALLNDIWEARMARKSPWPKLAGKAPEGDLLDLATARYMANGDKHLALEALGRIDAAESYLIKGRVLRKSPGQCRQVLEAGLKKYPKDPDLLLALARVLLDLRHTKRAAQLLDELDTRKGDRPAEYYLLRARLIEPTTTARANLIVSQIEEGLSRLLPRLDSRPLRRASMEMLARAAPKSDRALEILKQSYGKRRYDDFAGLALARAYLNMGRPQDCIGILDILESPDENDLRYAPLARLLRLRALDKLDHPDLVREIEEFLRDFPNEAREMPLFTYVRRLRRARRR